MSAAVTAVTQRRSRPHPLVVLLRALVVLALVAALLLGLAVAFAPAPSVAPRAVAAPQPEAAPVAVAWPEGARSAGYAVAGFEGAIESWGSEEAHPMASVTKLATVLIVLEAHPIEGDSRGAEIALDADDVRAQGRAIADNAPIAPVYDGMVVTQRDLIEWSLVDSAGNAVWSLANWAFGSIDGFLAAADAWADRHDLAHTSLADPAGLSAQSVSSAADLTRIGLMAVDDPVVLATLQLESVTIPGIGYAPNTNRILGEGDVDGGKTGTLKVWGRNLLVTAERLVDGERRRVVAVVMGTITAEEIDAQMLALVESLWTGFARREVLPEGTVVAEYVAPWGARVEARTQTALEADAFGEVVPSATVAVDEAIEPGRPRGEVGSASVTELSGETRTTSVRTTGMLAEPDLAWRAAHPLDALAWYLD
ncbi:D-alanyl-D-alanine carboxypeptidase family protein [Agrococcus carbonis]|uniref:D-alanyl-D-alanine carboxypeptidase n=1 Tax=Agrococcus carbonis TaxID=684552 RepID=A0A1H1KW90_9MICO|nr:D-alanyl-D-alanine carboxypeptidase [Agrococcus carbonis]SDR66045.1 D-alanyl-D-alanine carboxypeptidase [Agrococcus carbonis]